MSTGRKDIIEVKEGFKTYRIALSYVCYVDRSDHPSKSEVVVYLFGGKAITLKGEDAEKFWAAFAPPAP
jgi:hypothetical protein